MGFALTFFARRLAQGALIVLLVSFTIFALLRVVPGDPARIILGPMATDAVVEQTARDMGLRDPIPVQYVRCLGNVVQGHFGTSLSKARGGGSMGGGRDEARGERARVLDLVAETLPLTLRLAGMTLVFAALIALPLGIAGGLMAGRWPDKLALYAASIFVSMRNFWLAIVLALVVTAELGWIPSIDYQNIAYAILPAFVIAIEMSSLFARTLIDARELTVMTNSLDIAAFLAQAPGLRVKTTPGWVRANDNALIGGDTASVVRRFVFDAVFMGIAACDPDHGWMDCADEESELRRVLIEQTRQPVVLADDGKLGRHASIRTFALTTRLIVVANRPIGRPFDEIFTSAGVEVRHRRRSS